jgi:hypothetical protein
MRENFKMARILLRFAVLAVLLHLGHPVIAQEIRTSQFIAQQLMQPPRGDLTPPEAIQFFSNPNGPLSDGVLEALSKAPIGTQLRIYLLTQAIAKGWMQFLSTPLGNTPKCSTGQLPLYFEASDISARFICPIEEQEAAKWLFAVLNSPTSNSTELAQILVLLLTAGHNLSVVEAYAAVTGTYPEINPSGRSLSQTSWPPGPIPIGQQPPVVTPSTELWNAWGGPQSVTVKQNSRAIYFWNQDVQSDVVGADIVEPDSAIYSPWGQDFVQLVGNELSLTGIFTVYFSSPGLIGQPRFYIAANRLNFELTSIAGRNVGTLNASDYFNLPVLRVLANISGPVVVAAKTITFGDHLKNRPTRVYRAFASIFSEDQCPLTVRVIEFASKFVSRSNQYLNDLKNAGGGIHCVDNFFSIWAKLIELELKNNPGPALQETAIIAPSSSGQLERVYATTDMDSAVAAFEQATLETWGLKAANKVLYDVNTANLAGSKKELYLDLRNAEAIHSNLLVTPTSKTQQQLNAIFEKLARLRSELLPPVWSRTAEVQQAGEAPQPVLLLTERSDFVTRMAPTTALMQIVSIDGAQWLGLVEGEAGHPDLVRFSFDAQLTGDPYLIDLVNQDIEDASDRAVGTFSNWKLTASMEKIQGVQDDLTQVQVAGNILKVSAAVRSDQANLFLWRLGTPAGIHFDLKWEYTGPEGQKISGPDFAVVVSALRRYQPQPLVDVRQTEIANLGSTPASISYVLTQDGHAEPLPQPFVVPAFGKLALPGPLAMTAGLTAPAESVELVVDSPFRTANEFYQAKDQDLFQRFTITNNLPGVDPDRGGAMHFVEVRVQTAEVGSEAWQDLGSYHLTAGGAEGSQIKLSVLHSPDKQMRLRVSGTAYYENGSHTDLVSFETSDTSTTITPKNF